MSMSSDSHNMEMSPSAGASASDVMPMVSEQPEPILFALPPSPFRPSPPPPLTNPSVPFSFVRRSPPAPMLAPTGGGSGGGAGSASFVAASRRSPPAPIGTGAGSSSFSFLEATGLGAMQASADERSLPPTPRSPSPTCSPPGSPKRQKAAAEAAAAAAASKAAASDVEEDLDVRAAALGLHEVTQRVWRETALPPTPSSPSPTFSPPSSPKQRHAAELTAARAAEKLAQSLCAAREARGEGSASCGSDSEGGTMTELEVTAAIAAWEAGGAQHRGSRKKRQL